MPSTNSKPTLRLSSCVTPRGANLAPLPSLVVGTPLSAGGADLPPTASLLHPSDSCGRLFGYVRHRDRHEIAGQSAALVVYAASLMRPLACIFEDVGPIGHVPRPPGLTALCDALRPNDDVVVADLTRLSRDVRRLTHLYEEWRQAGIGLHTTAHGLVTTAYVAVTTYLEMQDVSNRRVVKQWRWRRQRRVMPGVMAPADQTPPRRRRR